MAFWNSDTDKDEKTEKERQSTAEINAEFAPKYARHGAYCRTLAVLNPETGSRAYLEGHQLPNGTWQINRVALIPVEGDEEGAEEGVRDVRPKHFGIPFYEAMVKLALHEYAELTTGGQPSGKTIEALGTEHFKAFGGREGFAFDLRGMPHVIVNGSVLSKGQFQITEFKEAVKIAARYDRGRANDDNEIIPSDLAVDFSFLDAVEGSETSLADLFGEVAGTESLDKILEKQRETGQHLQNMKGAVNLLEVLIGTVGRLKDTLHDGWSSVVSRPERVHIKRHRDLFPNSYESHFDEDVEPYFSKTLPAKLADMKKAGLDTSYIEKKIDELYMVGNLVFAQAVFNHNSSHPGDPNLERLQKYMEDHLKRAEKKARKLGKSKDEVKLIRQIVTSGMAVQESALEPFDELRQNLQNLRDEVEKKYNALQRKIQPKLSLKN